MAYIRAVQNGNYSAPSTWDGGVVPTTGDIACADTFRITIDTTSILATLSVAMADLVAAGGVAATTKTGGFILPDNSTTSIPSGIRFDHSMTVARSETSTTVPLHIRPGCTISLGPIVYVSGYAASGTTQLWVVRLDPETSTINATFADFTIPAIGSSAGYVIVLNTTVNGGTFNGTFGNCKYVNPGNNLAMMRFFAVGGTSMSTAYNIIINGVIDGYSGNGISFYMNPLSTGLPNQNFTYNGTTIGENSGSVSYCKALRIDNVHNVTFTSPLVIGSGFDVSDYEIDINGLRGTVLFQGEVTARYCSLYVEGAGDVTFDQAIYFNKNSIGFNLLNTGVIRTKSIIGYGNTSTTMDNTGGLYVNGNSEVIINGDLKYNSGTTMCSPMVSLMAASTKPVTITGNLDGRNAYVSFGSTDSSSCLWITNSRTGPITITGNVYGSESGNTSSVNSSSGAIRYSASTATYQNLTINGNVYGGTLSPAISGPSQANVVVDVNGEVHGGGLYGANTYGPPGIVLYNGYASVKALVHHSSGTAPVWGRVKFRNTLQAYVKGRDTSLLEFLLSTQINVIPTASDVRFGVSTGVTTGTLVVPQASTVLDGVVFDNGTTGTLSIGGSGTVDLSPITSAISTVDGKVTSIKTKTDQLTFTVDGVVADSSGGTTSVDLSPVTTAISTLQTDVSSVKAKTDKMVFSDVFISDNSSDQYYSNVIFLSGCSGANNSTIFTSISPNVITFTSGPVVSTAQSKFGGSSWYFDGSGGYMTVDAVDLHSMANFTVEVFLYISSGSSGFQHVIGNWNGITPLGWHIGVDAVGKPAFEVSASGSYEVPNSMSSETAMTLNAWHHFTFVKNGTTYTLYVDGVQSLQKTDGPSTMYNTGNTITIGANDIGQKLKGYIDSVRITGNISRYNSGFTPTSIEFPGITGTLETHIKAMPDVAADITSLQTLMTLLDSKVAAVKLKTDQLEFLVDGVKSSGGAGIIDLESEIQDLETILTAIKTKTDILTFTTGVNAIDSTI